MSDPRWNAGKQLLEKRQTEAAIEVFQELLEERCVIG